MADALNEAPSTVQRWKNCGRIPATKQPDVLDRAGQLGIRITTDDVVFPLKCRPDFRLAAASALASIGRPPVDDASMPHIYGSGDASVDCDRLPASQGSDA